MPVTGEGLRVSPTEGKEYGSVMVGEGEAVRLIPPDVKTGAVIIKVYSAGPDEDDPEFDPDETYNIYFGWDDQVDESNGMPLEEGESLSIEIDNSSQGVWAYGTEDTDEVRIMAIN